MRLLMAAHLGVDLLQLIDQCLFILGQAERIVRGYRTIFWLTCCGACIYSICRAVAGFGRIADGGDRARAE